MKRQDITLLIAIMASAVLIMSVYGRNDFNETSSIRDCCCFHDGELHPEGAVLAIDGNEQVCEKTYLRGTLQVTHEWRAIR